MRGLTTLYFKKHEHQDCLHFLKSNKIVNFALITEHRQDNYDRIRRKQAEFLVKSHVPATCICGLIVLDDDQENRAKGIMQNAGLELPIHIDKKRQYFYL